MAVKPLNIKQRKVLCKRIDKWWAKELKFQNFIGNDKNYINDLDDAVKRIKAFIMKDKLKKAYDVASHWLDTSVREGFPASVWNLFMKLED